MIVPVVALEACGHDFTIRRSAVRSGRKTKVKFSWVQNWEAPSFAKEAKDGPPARCISVVNLSAYRDLRQ